jgi:hypothetical protein
MRTMLPPDLVARLHAAADDPAKRLMLAVLEDAIHTYQSFVPTTRRARRLLHEVEEWFACEDARDPLTFVGVCNVLGVDAAHLRDGLARWRACQDAFGAAA